MLTFSTPLVKGTLIKRYKRFLADVTLESGEVITAHCPNTGSMKSCGAPGDTVWLTHDPSPKRKLKYTWEYTGKGRGYIGVNTQRPNRVVEQAVQAGRIPELAGYTGLRREVKYGREGKSRIDLLLEGDDRSPCYVEIKNATLREEDYICFPDAVTARGLKHVQELVDVVQDGGRAVLFFLVNRPDGRFFMPARHIHADYADALVGAREKGLEILCYRARSTLKGMDVGNALELRL